MKTTKVCITKKGKVKIMPCGNHISELNKIVEYALLLKKRINNTEKIYFYLTIDNKGVVKRYKYPKCSTLTMNNETYRNLMLLK